MSAQQSNRTARIERETRETKIIADINIDGSGVSEINTGIGFLDHMLECFSRHSLIDIMLKCRGRSPRRSAPHNRRHWDSYWFCHSKGSW